MVNKTSQRKPQSKEQGPTETGFPLTDKGEFGGSDFARAFLEARLGIQGDRFIPFTAGYEKLVLVSALDQNQGFPRGVVAQVIVPITIVIGLGVSGEDQIRPLLSALLGLASLQATKAQLEKSVLYFPSTRYVLSAHSIFVTGGGYDAPCVPAQEPRSQLVAIGGLFLKFGIAREGILRPRHGKKEEVDAGKEKQEQREPPRQTSHVPSEA